MLYLAVAVVCFALTAMLYKLALHRGCDREALMVAERITMVLLLAVFILLHENFHFSRAVVGFGILGGSLLFISRISLLYSFKYGKVSTSWTVVSLSTAIPVLASIFFWKESPDVRKTIGLLLVPVAIILLRENEEMY
jgi:uncharacterized membrane protein